MEQLHEWLTRAKIKAVKLGERDHVSFDNSKDDMIVYTRWRETDLQKRLTNTRITVRGNTMGFKVEATR